MHFRFGQFLLTTTAGNHVLFSKRVHYKILIFELFQYDVRLLDFETKQINSFGLLKPTFLRTEEKSFVHSSFGLHTHFSQFLELGRRSFHTALIEISRTRRIPS